MNLGELNYLAILVAGLVGFGVSGFWYSKALFANAWMQGNKFSTEDLTDPKPAMIKSVISDLVLAFGIAYVMAMAGTTGLVAGAVMGVGLAIFVHGAAGYPNYAFENRSNKLFGIHLGNSIVTMAVMGAILGIWN